MDEDVRAELRMLRARAYGPAADIDDDPVARERLAELEDMLRRPAEEEPPPAPVEPAPVPSSPGPSASGPESPAPEADEPVDAAAVVADGIPRRTLWLWTGSLVLVAALVGGITYAATAISPILRAGDGVRQIATLDPDDSADLADVTAIFGGGESTTVFEPFEGFLAVSTIVEWYGGDGSVCLAVVADEHIQDEAAGGVSVDGPIAYGCGAGSFPATAQLAINDALPDAVRERFADASALQFVLGDGQVGVFADTR